MKKLLSAFLFLVVFTAAFMVHAQVIPSIEWQKSVGGSSNDSAYCIQQTSDGGYIVAGSSYSNDSDVTENHGGEDYWIVKTDASGNIVWQKSFGGSSNDIAASIQQTSDGGFIVAGSSASNDGDVSGNHGLADYWIVKLDALGNLVWQKCFGGSKNDNAYSVQQTSDGGFIVAGSSYSNDDDVSGNHGFNDYWIVRLSSDGNLTWQKYFGGLHIDFASSVLQTADGGFIVAGSSSSPNGDVVGHHGSAFPDYWIMKLDVNGNIVWQKCLGSWEWDAPYSIRLIAGGGFIVAGYASFNNGDVTGNHGGSNDYWVAKLDPEGNLIWEKSLGGTGDDRAYSIDPTSDGGFIIAGGSNSDDGDVSGRHGASGNDEWIVKLNADGNLIWQKMWGGFGDELAYSILQTSEGGFIVAGSSNSHGGDVSGNHGNYDYWIVKLTSDQTGIASLSTNFISLYPNPVQSELNIDLTTSSIEATIRVYDLQGRIMSLPVSDFLTSSSVQLNTTSLSDGFYTLQIIDNKTGASTVGKFVKQQ